MKETTSDPVDAAVAACKTEILGKVHVVKSQEVTLTRIRCGDLGATNEQTLREEARMQEYWADLLTTIEQAIRRAMVTAAEPLAKALLRYGSHEHDCNYHMAWHERDQTCDCGWKEVSDAARRARDEGEAVG